MPDTRISPETRALIAQQWQDMLDKIAAGDQVGKTVTAAGFSRDKVRAFIASEPNARDEWNEAREASADALYDQVLAIANNPGADPKAARVRLQALMYAMGVRNPRVYGAKANLTVDVRTVDLTRIINDAQARLEASRQVGNAALLAPILGIAQRVLDEPET